MAGSCENSSGQKIKFFWPTTPGEELDWHFLAMARNVHILVGICTFWLEFVHFGETMVPTRKHFKLFLANPPRPGKSQNCSTPHTSPPRRGPKPITNKYHLKFSDQTRIGLFNVAEPWCRGGALLSSGSQVGSWPSSGLNSCHLANFSQGNLPFKNFVCVGVI